jgi:ABC-type transport system involved in multi-copper enzyme maturation permease subunit
MAMRFGTGPVFEAECLTASRRVGFYSARVLLVLGLLVGLAVVWVSHRHLAWNSVVQELARIGEAFYTAIMGIELAMALLVAPAAASGAICDDRARGGLALMMATDLSDSEIVLGRLASRLLSTLGVVACGLPVLALTTLLGGVDPVAVAGGTLVVLGVATLSVSMALTFSLWAGKPYEAHSATYAVWAVWLLGFQAWKAMVGATPEWVRWLNPFWLLFSNWSISFRLPQECAFFVACLAGSAALALLSTWKLRSVTLDRRGKPAKARVAATRRMAPGWLRWLGQASPRLDDDPILWREWHRKRPSTYTLAIWWTYAVLCTLCTIMCPVGSRIAPFVNGFQVSVGLLLACVGAATSLAEERAQGGLDVVLATPIDSRRIVLGKWWGAFRIIPRLAILPALLMLKQGWVRGVLPEAVGAAALVVGLVLAYGAAVTGLGLLVAIHQPTQRRAVALTVACYVAATMAYPAIVLPVFNLGPPDSLPLWVSPFFGVLVPTLGLDVSIRGFDVPNPVQAIGFLGFEMFVARVLLKVALGSFDRGMGRVADRSRRVEWEPLPELEVVGEMRDGR